MSGREYSELSLLLRTSKENKLQLMRLMVADDTAQLLPVEGSQRKGLARLDLSGDKELKCCYVRLELFREERRLAGVEDFVGAGADGHGVAALLLPLLLLVYAPRHDVESLWNQAH